MKSKFLIFSLCVILLCSSAVYFSSCSKEAASTKDVLAAVIAAEVGLPSGNIYLSDAPKGDKRYTDSSLLASLYGNGSAPVECGEWVEFAIFLSSAKHPCEFAVFLCESSQSVSDTAKMLCRRLDLLKTAWSDTEYSSYTQNARVTVSGNFCFFIVSSDADAAQKAALSLI